MMSSVPNIVLNNGVEIPQLGFGVFQIDRPQTVHAVLTAFDAGYRHIDTAQMYGNEGEVGQAVEESGLPRNEIFITTKLNNDQHGYDSAITAFDESLERLRTDYVDLYLIHWPVHDEARYIDTWTALEALLADGKARAIGVSNLRVGHLERLAERNNTVPAVNQVELHPNVQQSKLRAYHKAHSITTEAWSPIARGKTLRDPTIRALAEKYGKSPAQVILRWHVQEGNIVLIKSATPSRIQENIEIFDFELAPGDMRTMARLDGDPDGAPSYTEEVAARMPYWRP